MIRTLPIDINGEKYLKRMCYSGESVEDARNRLEAKRLKAKLNGKALGRKKVYK